MQNYFPEYEIAFSFWVLKMNFFSSAVINCTKKEIQQISIYHELDFDLNRHAKCNFDNVVTYFSEVHLQSQFSSYRFGRCQTRKL